MEIHYIHEIPEIVLEIKSKFIGIPGVKKVDVNIRVINTIIVYVFIDEEAAAACKSDMVLPAEVGITYKRQELNQQRHPRLWLLERRAEIEAEKAVSGLTLEFVIFLERANGSYVVL